MNSEDSQTINHLLIEIKKLKEQVADLQFRADKSFNEEIALMMVLSATAYALDNNAKERAKLAFESIKKSSADKPDPVEIASAYAQLLFADQPNPSHN
ncbi:hypothetical protein [Yersinia kristensenii]|uniref:hypothetical protein n=1 Tax=Yersinia kristensenii TaxID=28152 RepID=UPI0001A550CD|nr:hypothetical protein [Yersinia kristensenii]EEP91791.1 hypothetical protein ykris0001_9150 [Yersinia kristensenii ATCC 33638]SUP67203.1 Uncharacterised protein [Yersinia kristensenii]